MTVVVAVSGKANFIRAGNARLITQKAKVITDEAREPVLATQEADLLSDLCASSELGCSDLAAVLAG